jgi:diguanylate cyclase (GGDEF)-like protein/PAS domain S-box-containing protein
MADEEAGVPDAGDAGHHVLLLVEDDPDHAFLVRRQLSDSRELGLPVVHLTTAAAAAARLAAGDVRCVVLDLSLPDAHGMQALHAVREVAPAVPVVVLTGLDSDDSGLQALQVGAQDYLVKGRHAPDAVPRSVLFAIERARRQEAERGQVLLGRQLAVRDVQLSEAQRLARVGSWEWDIASGEVVWSDELRRLTGLSDVAGTESFSRYLELVPEQDRAEVARLFSAQAAGRAPVTVRHALVRPDGAQRWIEGHMTAAGWDESLRPVRVLGTMQDVTAQKTAEDQLVHQALHDSLTGLANRGVLLDRLGRVLAAGRDDESLVAVVFLDLDQFKWVNDSRSHSTGDRLLESAVRPTDTLARFGGDEFVVLCERVRADEGVLQVVQRIRAALAKPFALDADGEQAVDITASMGVATARPGSGADPELLVRDADIAMYRAKERGRARYEIFDEAMRDRAAARLQRQRDLSLALQRDELEVHFQPVVDVRSDPVTTPAWSPGRRRWCAGATPCGGCWDPTSSSRTPSRPGWSSSSASPCSTRPAPSPPPGTPGAALRWASR